jgi:radical SAM protein (TIGR01212 family)
MNTVRYNHLNTHLKNKFGERTLKVCVDGGFSCPNRDGKCGFGGCIFCGEMGAGENIKYRLNDCLDSIRSQIEGFLSSYRGDRANKFIVYFQSFTNTYDSLDNLKQKYDVALSTSDKIVGLQVATRPDCVDDDVAKLLASYKNKYYVCVELGFQTANDKVGEYVHRGYTTQQFVDTVNLLHKYNIDVVAHVMVGLPNEQLVDIQRTINIINNVGCEGIKIHSTYVTSDSKLCKMYENGIYTPISQEYYVDIVAYIISNLNKDIVIHRINADPPKNLLIAPNWVLKKKIVINAINRKLSELGIYQGDREIDITQICTK